MKILHITGMGFPTKYGSYERWLTEVSRQALGNKYVVYIAYGQSKGDVKVFSDALEAYGVRLVVLKDDEKIIRFCKENEIDIVHFHFDFHSHDFLYLQLKKMGVRLYASLHCECYYYVNSEWKKNVRSWVRINGHRIKTHRRMQLFDRIFACSQAIKHQYKQFYFLHDEKIECLYLGIQPKRECCRESNIIPVITCTAFHSPIKGVDILLNALKYLKDKGIAFKCYQIGGGSSELNGEDTNQLKLLCSNLGLNEYVEWVGITNFVDTYLRKTDIYCQPSRTEAICLSIAEAMEFGIPVVASNVGGIPELVENNVNGFLVTKENPALLAERLETLIINEKLRQAMGIQSKKRLDQLGFYQEQSVDVLMKHYNNG